MGSEAARERTREDFATAVRLGVTGFPTLALFVDAELYLVTSGYTTDAVLEERIARIERLARERSGATAAPGVP
jgi:protein-disulfide isomerase-like protein with CxxC motif